MNEETTEDRGLKELFAAYPRETVAVLVPELLADGELKQVVALQQELSLGELGEPSRFLDLALLLERSDGRRSIVVLVEHWSESRKVDLERVGCYVFGLRARHRVEVVPVVLVTDSGDEEVGDRIVSAPLADVRVELRVRVVRLEPALVPRLRALQSIVAAVLLARALREEAVTAVLAASEAMARSGATLAEARLYLPLVVKLAKMSPTEVPELRRRLRRRGHAMPSVLDVLWEQVREESFSEGRAEGRAEGRVEGRMEGRLAELQRLVRKGYLTPVAAEAELADLVASGELSAEAAAACRAAWQ
ncbi:MAG: hypothetical protein RMM29_03825 [Planctomycetota bacterium]|nr:hypothetical protein [Planctomycetota bacterium]